MESNMNIYEKLSYIQNEMKVPKNLFNKFGKYYYRNAESILDAAKPVCAKHKTTLKVMDEIVFIEGRFYVKGIATLYDWETDDYIENVSFAREDEAKTGMDLAQLTGSCSSYARKYALNGLFNLDDVKDADTDEQKQETEAKTVERKEIPATAKQVEMIGTLYTQQEIEKMLENLHKKELKEITIEQASKMIAARKGK